MSKKILVLGGSYFAGRVFVMVASQRGYELTVVNRGRFSVKSYENVTEYACDRHDYQTLSKLPLEKEYDAVVDFCAYAPGDIENLWNYLPCSAHRYIYISTADVHEKTAGIRNEESPMMSEGAADQVQSYTYKKMLLEKELFVSARQHEAEYVVLRPTFIYGPFNYAPRESYYIKKIIEGTPLPVPKETSGKFQMVFVKDVANAIVSCIEEEKAANQAYILSAPEVLDYHSFIQLLRDISDLPFTVDEVPLKEITEKNMPLPFPLTEADNELFAGEKITKDLPFQYSSLQEKMKFTYQNLRSVYQK